MKPAGLAAPDADDVVVGDAMASTWVTLVCRLRKLDQAYDPTDRGVALETIQERIKHNEYLTGLLYIAKGQPEFHAQNATPDGPLNQLPYERLRPPAADLPRSAHLQVIASSQPLQHREIAGAMRQAEEIETSAHMVQSRVHRGHVFHILWRPEPFGDRGRAGPDARVHVFGTHELGPHCDFSSQDAGALLIGQRGG